MSTESIVDLKLICKALAEGRKVDSALVKKVRARADQVRAEVLKKHGFVNVSDLTARESESRSDTGASR